MAVTFDAVGTQFQSISGAVSPLDVTAVTFALTVGVGANRALVVQVCFRDAITVPVVTWDQGGTNQNVPLILSRQTANGQIACVFGLVAPTSGNKAIRVAWTGGATELSIQAVSWTSVDQTGGATSFPNATSAVGNNAAATVDVTSAVGDAVMSAVVCGSLQALNSVSATQTLLTHGTGVIEAGGSRAAGAATVTVTGTLAGTDQWAIVGTSIKASGGAASTQMDWQAHQQPPRNRVEKLSVVSSGSMPGKGKN